MLAEAVVVMKTLISSILVITGRTDGIGGTTNAGSGGRGNINALGYGVGGGGHTHSTSYSNPDGGNGSQGIVIIKYPES